MFDQAKLLSDFIDSLPEPKSLREKLIVAISNIMDDISIAVSVIKKIGATV